MWMLNFHREGIWNIFRWAGSIVGIMAGPSFAYYSGVLYSMPADVWAQNPSWDLMLCNVDNAKFYIFWLYGYGLFCFFFSIYLESRNYQLTPQQFKVQDDNYDPEQLVEGEEIENERKRLSDSSNNDLVKIQNVEKVYSNGFKALSDITFGVEKGQIFCFLGPNGAGKSTTFKILTAAEARSSGYVELLGKAIDSGSYHIFDNVGICPQYDPIWNELNPIEHLRIYAMMKGVKK